MKLLFSNSFVIVLLFLVSLWSFGAAEDTKIAIKVGVIVEYDRWIGKMGLSCINMALSDFYASNAHCNTRLVLHIRDSKEDVVEAASAALDLIKNLEVQAIIGPQTSMQSSFIIDLGSKAQVPVISYSATSPSLNIPSSYFFRATQNEASQVLAISAIVRTFGWKHAVPIYVDDKYMEGLIPYLTVALQQVDAVVPYRIAIPPSASNDQLLREIDRLMKLETRVYVVHMYPSLVSQFFKRVNQLGLMDQGYAWILTTMTTDLLSSMDSSIIRSMQGVLGIKTYVEETDALKDFRAQWKRQLHDQDIDLNIFGLWAYDAATALAIAVEDIGDEKISFRMRNFSANSTDLQIFGVSENGPKLGKALSDVNFQGLAGNFSLINGELQYSNIFEIVNVNGIGERGIGFWTPQNGLSRDLKTSTSTSTNTSTIYSTSKGSTLGPVIWPGESTSVPRGWTFQGTFKIGFESKEGLNEFANVIEYSKDVFLAALRLLPYSVPYQFVPFGMPGGLSTDEMVHEVSLGNLDSAVGHTTITASRLRYVDFTRPYTEAGVSMVVPLEDNKNKNAWVFLKPLTWDLWATIFCFFVFIGFVVWVLEHGINHDFQGSTSHQLGTIFWFSFSTMVSAHQERILSNLARFVVIIWIFVVLILTQSYAASLTTFLTVQQLQLNTVTDYTSELLKNGDNVGYREGSFVYGVLKGLGFDDSNLKAYKSPDDCDELFSRKSIAAAFDEIPYMKLFHRRYCSKYTMMFEVSLSLQTDGLGFVFQRGSPILNDVSMTIANMREGGELKKLEEKWFGKQTSCPDLKAQASISLGLESFWGLFLIAGIASLSALMIHAAIFFYKQRHVIKSCDPEASIWYKIRLLLKQSTQIQDRKGSTEIVDGLSMENTSTSAIELIIQDQEVISSSPE